MFDRLIDYDSSGTKHAEKLSDFQSLLEQTQDRLTDALSERYQYNTSIKRGQDFLLNHVSSKVPLVVLYADLVGSTDMSMTLPPDKLVTIIRAFSHEMSSVVKNYNGYVLKYVGDAVIGYFIAEENPLVVSDNAVNCAKNMIDVIERGINPILSQYEYPELSVKIGMDFGENVVVRYGSDQIRSHIDILGPSVSIAAKITALATPNQILIGEDIYEKLHPSLKELFEKVEWHSNQWNYQNRETGKIYGVYSMHL